jgi:thiamine pyrophosphate-dependent acetolactate synthase large subunit-like protein
MLKRKSQNNFESFIQTDVGQNQVWVAQPFKIKNNQRIFFSDSHGAMGYSLPAAIGACLTSKSLFFVLMVTVVVFR